jgi:UDP-N-acetylmuramoyl-tripeptide--D-alanyl-D-alanine ligase
MIATRLAAAAGWAAAALHGADGPFRGVSTDTRTLVAGQLFVALRGERHDGHDHVAEAARRGAAAVLVERALPGVELPQLVVADSLAALGELARHWRRSLRARVVAVTGSNGKTTLKTLLSSVLSRAGRTAATPGNLNNEVGLPLTVLGLDPALDFAVLEMGAGKPGDIRYLADIGQPDVAVVNNIGPAHLERMGSLEGIAATKGGIYEALGADGIGVVNADDAFAAYFRGLLGRRRRVEFGLEADADVGAAAIAQFRAGSRFALRTPAGTAPVELALAGRHNVMNALAAAACATALGIDVRAIAAGLEAAHAVAGRLDRIEHPDGWILVDDSYNANPASTMAGIATLVGAGGTPWLALGDMKELGAREAELHAEVGRYARHQGVERLFTVGPLAAHAAAAFGARAQSYPDRESLAADLARSLAPGVCVLVKGSRSSGMDQVVAAVLAAHGMQRAGDHHAA